MQVISSCHLKQAVDENIFRWLTIFPSLDDYPITEFLSTDGCCVVKCSSPFGEPWLSVLGCGGVQWAVDKHATALPGTEPRHTDGRHGIEPPCRKRSHTHNATSPPFPLIPIR